MNSNVYSGGAAAYILLPIFHRGGTSSQSTWVTRPFLFCFVFDDEQESRGIIRLASASTASYTVILDNKGDCQFGIGDLKIHDRLTVDKVNRK